MGCAARVSSCKVFDIPAGRAGRDGPLGDADGAVDRGVGHAADPDGDRAVRSADDRRPDVGVRRGVAGSRIQPGARRRGAGRASARRCGSRVRRARCGSRCASNRRCAISTRAAAGPRSRRGARNRRVRHRMRRATGPSTCPRTRSRRRLAVSRSTPIRPFTPAERGSGPPIDGVGTARVCVNSRVSNSLTRSGNCPVNLPSHRTIRCASRTSGSEHDDERVSTRRLSIAAFSLVSGSWCCGVRQEGARQCRRLHRLRRPLRPHRRAPPAPPPPPPPPAAAARADGGRDLRAEDAGAAEQRASAWRRLSSISMTSTISDEGGPRCRRTPTGSSAGPARASASKATATSAAPRNTTSVSVSAAPTR